MKYLEVHTLKGLDGPLPPTAEYTVSSYPGPGLYINPHTGMLMAVGACVMCLGLATNYPVKDMGAATDAAPAQAMSEGFGLKLVALVQQPQLATTLLPTKVA